MSLGSRILSQGYLKRVPRDLKFDVFPYELRIAIDLQCVPKGSGVCPWETGYYRVIICSLGLVITEVVSGIKRLLTSQLFEIYELNYLSLHTSIVRNCMVCVIQVYSAGIAWSP